MRSDFLFSPFWALKRPAMYCKSAFLCAVVGCAATSALQAQVKDKELVSSAADTYVINPDAIITWTIGETAIDTYTSNSVMFVEGFHQPAIAIVVVEEAPGFKNSVSVFPNPAVEYISIRLDESASGLLKAASMPKKVRAELLDIGGQLVYKEDFEGADHKIDVHLLANGMYLLRLTNTENNSPIGSYSVEKLR